jgi:hypothetical protein
MPRLALVPALALALLPAACGGNRFAPQAPALGPEAYVIAQDDVPSPGAFIRYQAPRPGHAGGLDVAVTDYRSRKGGAPVTLVGTVHVADAHFFAAVQAELDRHPCVLYEGVKPKGLSRRDWQARMHRRGGELADLQRSLARWFGLEFQLDAIDYGRPNLVHADMSVEEFLAAGGGAYVPVHAGGAPGPKAAPPAAGHGAARGVSPALEKTWDAVQGFGEAALGHPGPLRSMARRMFAETLGTVDMGRALEMQPGFSDLVLRRRNEVVIDKLRQVLPEATGPVAIFYGAAHMPDLEKRLRKLGYERSGAHWLRAWALRPPLPD